MLRALKQNLFGTIFIVGILGAGLWAFLKPGHTYKKIPDTAIVMRKEYDSYIDRKFPHHYVELKNEEGIDSVIDDKNLFNTINIRDEVKVNKVIEYNRDGETVDVYLELQ